MDLELIKKFRQLQPGKFVTQWTSYFSVFLLNLMADLDCELVLFPYIGSGVADQGEKTWQSLCFAGVFRKELQNCLFDVGMDLLGDMERALLLITPLWNYTAIISLGSKVQEPFTRSFFNHEYI